MRFRPFSSIKVEQVKKELRDDLAIIFGQLNPFLLQFNNIFNKGISIENLSMDIVTASVEVDSSGKPKTQLILSKANISELNGVIIINVQKNSPNDPFLSSAPFVEFQEGASSVEVKCLLGFPANVKYFVTFLLL